VATVEAHQEQTTSVQVLLDRMVRYQKHKPGAHLSLERMPKEVFRIESIHQFGSRIIINGGAIALESAPAVVERGGRIALLLPTGEELYFYAE
jgi:hypothetical protein